MKKPAYKAGDFVTHALDANRRGMVTAYSCGFNGFSYRVTWAADFEDQTHYEQELVPEKKPNPPVGFTAKQ